jgi:iron complex outermembrane recepter protein
VSRRPQFVRARAGSAEVNRTRRHLLNYAALGLMPVVVGNASGERRKLRLAIDAGSAAVTLAEFIRQTGLQVLFETDAIRGHTTRAVSGQLDANEALRVMLDGSGLMFEFINERTVAVRPQPLARL